MNEFHILAAKRSLWVEILIIDADPVVKHLLSECFDRSAQFDKRFAADTSIRDWIQKGLSFHLGSIGRTIVCCSNPHGADDYLLGEESDEEACKRLEDERERGDHVSGSFDECECRQSGREMENRESDWIAEEWRYM